MKKQFLTLLAVILMIGTGITARAQAFEQSNSIISVGYGFPNVFKSVYSIYDLFGGYSSSGFGPINAKYEYAVTDNIGVGVIASYLSYKVRWDYDDGSGTVYEEGYKGSLFAILVRANYHFATGDKLDPYVGVGAGYINYGFDYYNTDPSYAGGDLSVSYGAPLAYGASVGARYYFTDNIGAYAELGWDALSLMQIGLSMKF